MSCKSTQKLFLPVFILLGFLSLTGCGSTRASVRDLPRGDRLSVVRTAYSQMGKPYKYGGTSPRTGFDCSGFTSWVYGQNGLTLPRRSQDQRRVGRKVRKENLKEADLVFFGVDKKASLHVGIYVGKGGFVHAPSSGGRVRRDSLRQRYWNRSFLEGRRVLP